MPKASFYILIWICFMAVFVYMSSWALEISSELQVAQYASDGGNGNTAFNDVDQCLRYLQ